MRDGGVLRVHALELGCGWGWLVGAALASEER
jgi:cyclopropane fatty-acyl-phospholipid synthase-like methyltransferase